MTEYKNEVERQRKLLEAEEWAGKVKSIHAHSLSSMWYDTRPQDTQEHGVVDTEYNDGLVERQLHTGELVYFGTRLTGDELIYEWEKHNENK